MAAPPEQKCHCLHGVQTTASAGLYRPFAHVVHLLEPATETWMALHGVHVVKEMAANTAENVSIWHGVHTALPFAFAVYVPAVHDTQSVCCERASRSCVDFPATHDTQVVMLVAAILAEYVPAIHEVHVCVPLEVLYVPAGHIAHVPPSGPVDPALQLQSVSSSLAGGEFDRNGHASHTFETAPIATEYLPISQLVHTASPVSTLYLLATHEVQVPPLTPVKPALHLQSICSSLAAGESE